MFGSSKNKQIITVWRAFFKPDKMSGHALKILKGKEKEKQMKITKSVLDSVLNKEGEIRYIGKPTNNKMIGKITCYGPDGFKPPARGNVVYQKQIYRKGIWVNI